MALKLRERTAQTRAAGPASAEAANDSEQMPLFAGVFQVIPERAEKAAVIVTTNLPFSEWTQVIPNARLCKALLDRITDRAHIIETGTESYRFRRTLENAGAELSSEYDNRAAAAGGGKRGRLEDHRQVDHFQTEKLRGWGGPNIGIKVDRF
jgi:IstB-like ATP binding protein